jgi:hypothetical protein
MIAGSSFGLFRQTEERGAMKKPVDAVHSALEGIDGAVV